jgi:hypothetical protein
MTSTHIERQHTDASAVDFLNCCRSAAVHAEPKPLWHHRIICYDAANDDTATHGSESGAETMNLCRPVLALSAAALLTAPALTQEGAPHPGRAMVLSKCFQCHTDAMFRDQRQDHRAWEATIYRMVGRGALWTPEEIRLMADYLGTDLGPNAKPAAAPAPATSTAPAR